MVSPAIVHSELGTDIQIQGEVVRRQIGAHKYMECSARTGEGVEAVLDAATRLAITRTQSRNKRKCNIL